MIAITQSGKAAVWNRGLYIPTVESTYCIVSTAKWKGYYYCEDRTINKNVLECILENLDVFSVYPETLVTAVGDYELPVHTADELALLTQVGVTPTFENDSEMNPELLQCSVKDGVWSTREGPVTFPLTLSLSRDDVKGVVEYLRLRKQQQ
jgi:hypothetical protein